MEEVSLLPSLIAAAKNRSLDLNQTRRRAIEALSSTKLAQYQRTQYNLGETVLFNSFPPKDTGRTNLLLSAWVADLKSVAAAVETGANIIYIGGDELTGFHWTPKLVNEAQVPLYT